VNETRAAISLEGAALERGQTIKMVCPFCHGGQSGEAKFYLTKDYDTGILLYCCHRASCAANGRLGGNHGGAVAAAPKHKPFTPWDDSWFRPITAESVAGVGLGMVLGYLDKYPWTAKLRTLQWDHQTRRLATPYHNYMGYKSGYVLRSLTGGKPKTLIARLTDREPVIDWYTNGEDVQNDRLILVEDQQSAARLAVSGNKSLALLGITPSNAMLEKVFDAEPKKVWIALDPGAERAAFKIHRRLFAIVDTQIALLRQDIKDMGAEEYNAWLESYGFSRAS